MISVNKITRLIVSFEMKASFTYSRILQFAISYAVKFFLIVCVKLVF